MWLGFFAWYQGLAMLAARCGVDQIQLLQPLRSMLMAEFRWGQQRPGRLTTVGFGLAVVAACCS
jgi:hypothetical protein